MSNKEFYDSQISEIEAISADMIKKPNMPIDACLKEGEQLVETVKSDADKLLEAGLDGKFIESLNRRCGALRYIQSEWMSQMNSVKGVEKLWSIESPKAYELRDDILHYFRFAFRKSPDLMKTVNKIAEGASHADMIQDLSDLSALGKKNQELLKKVGMNMEWIDQAMDMSDAMADLLAKATGSRSEVNDMKSLRDRAYTHLKEAVDEIRDHGKFIFYKEPDKQKKYRSNYHK